MSIWHIFCHLPPVTVVPRSMPLTFTPTDPPVRPPLYVVAVRERPRRRHLRREEKSVLGSPLSFFFLLSVLFPLPHIICAHEMRARMTRTDSYGLRYSILWYPFFLVRATTNVMQKRRRNDKKDQTHIQKNKNDACKRIDASPSTSNRHLPFLSKST